MVLSTTTTFSAIIVFNGGSFGDFLKACCLLALDQPAEFVTDRKVFEFGGSEKTSFKLLVDRDPDHSLTNVLRTIHGKNFFCKVESCHYYNKDFEQYCSNIFFIEYQLSKNDLIANRFIEKKLYTELNNYKYFKNQLVKQYNFKENRITDDVIKKHISLTWKKQQDFFQKNIKNKINIVDLFDFNSLVNAITNICGVCNNQDLIYNIWAKWYKINQDFINDYSS